jgi:hypothetical protein
LCAARFSVILYSNRFAESSKPEDMTVTRQHLPVAILAFAMAASAAGQASPPAAVEPLPQTPTLAAPPAPVAPNSLALENRAASPLAAAPGQLFDFKDSDIKFNLSSLMSILRDNRHEGWVLAAYPDPKTSRPLIGAGFSLDVQKIDHPQLDPLNSRPFIEPSSAQLWQAAGLDPERLQTILDQYDRDLDAWAKTKFRRKIRTHTLTPQITGDEATQLLRISAIQAVQNAGAYCRDFDQLTASQQMALSQLVFQMGVNLQEFVQFLGAMNGDTGARASSQPGDAIETDLAHWNTVQHLLIESQWARRYSGRAATVIAMFDPQYEQDPGAAERRVAATLHPAVVHRRRGRSAGSVRVASYSRRVGRTSRKKAPRSQAKRKLA